MIICLPNRYEVCIPGLPKYIPFLPLSGVQFHSCVSAVIAPFAVFSFVIKGQIIQNDESASHPGSWFRAPTEHPASTVIQIGTSCRTRKLETGPYNSQVQKAHSPNLPKEKCIDEVARIGSKIIFHMSKLWKAKFFILCDVILLVRPQEKFEIDHSWE